MYWKETKTFENGCGSHLMNGYYAKGNLLLPDQATFIIDNTVIGEDTMLEANHHCNVGTTGVLCMPTYVLHKVKKVTKTKRQPHRPFLAFQKSASQQHNANQNHVRIYISLSVCVYIYIPYFVLHIIRMVVVSFVHYDYYLSLMFCFGLYWFCYCIIGWHFHFISRRCCYCQVRWYG